MPVLHYYKSEGSPNIFISGAYEISKVLSGPKMYKHISFLIEKIKYYKNSSYNILKYT